jgi:glycosyltransferase involved in cell wall biosynthesis
LTAALVSHPHAGAVSVAAAQAFERHGQLAQYASGFVVSDRTQAGQLAGRLAPRYPMLSNRILTGIAPAHLNASPLGELLARAMGRVGQTLGRSGTKYDALFGLHDVRVSRLHWPREVDTVYAYEDGALCTFRNAKKKSGHIACVWDLPLPEYHALKRVWTEESARWPEAAVGAPHQEPPWKAARKDEELNLSDVVSVASAHTRRSLEEIGVSKPIAVAAYGFPVETFAEKSGPNQGPFTVLSVGTHDLRKGTPYLLEAWRLADLKNARLQLIGPLRLSDSFVQRYAGQFEHIPHLPKARLGEWYQSADVLAFPTLGDGFGLVIQEAMASGTPVITTRMGGGPECIESGVDGWIIEDRSIDALIENFRFCASNRDSTHSMGKAARRRAESWTWREAGDTFVSQLSTALARA